MLKILPLPLARLRPPLRPASALSLLICKSSMSETTKPISPKFISLEGKEQHDSNGYKFRLVSYNILAQAYVKSSYFPYSPSPCLKWKARSQAVLTHLKNFDADFLCIQELDEYEGFYKKNMESIGYCSVYIQRTGDKRDGCGIFYKPTCAELILTEEIYYNDLVDSLAHSNGFTLNGSNDTLESEDEPVNDSQEKKSKKERGDPNDPRVRLKRDCVGLLTAFKLNDPSNHILVIANTHIYWDPEWVDVKLAQAKYLLSRLSDFREVVFERFKSMPSVIVAGDFNSTPGDQVYNYLVSAGQQEEAAAAAIIKLHSLYAENGGEPKYTNVTPGFTGTLDYIFFSRSHNSNKEILKAVSLLHVPGPDSPDVTGGLPNHFHPSDHLPIGADFVLLNPSFHSFS